MKKLFFTAIFIVLSSCNFATAQDEKICISQEAANKCASLADEVAALRDAVEKFKIERGASDALIKGLNELIEIKNRTISANEQLTTIYSQIIKIQNSIIETLEKRLNKPKSALQKILSFLEKLFLIVAGVGIGRGL